MALLRQLRGKRALLDLQPLCDGRIYFCTDDGTFHLDYADAEGNLHRKQINAKEAESLTGYSIATLLNSSDAEIPTSKAVLDELDKRIVIATDEQILAWLKEENVVEPVASATGEIYITNNNEIYIL